MKKHLFGFTLALLLLMTACGGKENTPIKDPDPETPVDKGPIVSADYAALFDDTQIMLGANWVGAFSEEEAINWAQTTGKSLLNAIPELVVLEGNEAYLIVPRYEDTVVTIQAMNPPNEKGELTVGETLKTVTGKSLLLLCNLSDLWPNVQVTVQHGDQSIAFSPYVSLKDGAVILPDEARRFEVK